jgi:phosphoribosylglycinamide formyltransferase-1
MISGSGTLLQALLDADRAEDAAFSVAAVVSDRDGVAGLDRARAASVPTAVVPLSEFPDRDAWDRAVVRTLDTFHPDLVVCAGFMKLLGAPVVEAYAGRIVNTHPALLPSFPGAHGVRDALAHGVKVTGCSVILVDTGVDSGPILAQRAVDVQDDDTEDTLHERIKVVERELLVDVVTRIARGGLVLAGRHARLGAAR